MGTFNINLVTRHFRNLLFGDGDYRRRELKQWIGNSLSRAMFSAC